MTYRGESPKRNLPFLNILVKKPLFHDSTFGKNVSLSRNVICRYIRYVEKKISGTEVYFDFLNHVGL